MSTTLIKTWKLNKQWNKKGKNILQMSEENENEDSKPKTK
jgi:hypothetical protein